ncbi:hypothetical protein HanIR_Chr13g0653151 [Helianthus annuus]|nr:hypothetical protein HanIR_Chr13g0653151 [Helianthus annuus]
MDSWVMDSGASTSFQIAEVHLGEQAKVVQGLRVGDCWVRRPYGPYMGLTWRTSLINPRLVFINIMIYL